DNMGVSINFTYWLCLVHHLRCQKCHARASARFRRCSSLRILALNQSQRYWCQCSTAISSITSTTHGAIDHVGTDALHLPPFVI
ncbi:unnamed protein product, partial [Mycena citricolor]